MQVVHGLWESLQFLQVIAKRVLREFLGARMDCARVECIGRVRHDQFNVPRAHFLQGLPHIRFVVCADRSAARIAREILKGIRPNG